MCYPWWRGSFLIAHLFFSYADLCSDGDQKGDNNISDHSVCIRNVTVLGRDATATQTGRVTNVLHKVEAVPLSVATWHWVGVSKVEVGEEFPAKITVFIKIWKYEEKQYVLEIARRRVHDGSNWCWRRVLVGVILWLLGIGNRKNTAFTGSPRVFTFGALSPEKNLRLSLFEELRPQGEGMWMFSGQ